MFAYVRERKTYGPQCQPSHRSDTLSAGKCWQATAKGFRSATVGGWKSACVRDWPSNRAFAGMLHVRHAAKTNTLLIHIYGNGKSCLVNGMPGISWDIFQPFPHISTPSAVVILGQMPASLPCPCPGSMANHSLSRKKIPNQQDLQLASTCKGGPPRSGMEVCLQAAATRLEEVGA